ncbi:MAG TPA: hypothetical protein VNU26_17830, partial [Mycobacteriales bacterium]|nr:hypothetical protein [Mycobacteriales bacterium]
LGMGDVLTLIEQAEQSFDRDTAERMAGKLQTGEDFDLEDFLEQMKQMGGMAGLPGMGGGRKAKRQQQKSGKKGKRGPGRAGGPKKSPVADGAGGGGPALPQGLPQLPQGFSLPPGLGGAPKNGPDPLGLRRPR